MQLSRQKDNSCCCCCCAFVFYFIIFMHFCFYRVHQFFVARAEKEKISFPWGSIWAMPGESYICGCLTNMEKKEKKKNPFCLLFAADSSGINKWCVSAISRETDNDYCSIFSWKKSHLTITSPVKKKKAATVRSLQVCSALSPAGREVLAVKKLWHLVQCVCVRACIVCVWAAP